jgi:hypothetical protein
MGKIYGAPSELTEDYARTLIRPTTPTSSEMRILQAAKELGL